MTFTTNNKLLFLLIMMILGMGGLSFSLFKHQEASEYHIKTLYFGSLLPISNLKEILLLVQGDVALKVYEKRVNPINLDNLAWNLKKADKEIMRLWKEYATRYKSNEEKAFVAHVDLKMQALHRYILELSQRVLLLRSKNTGISFKALSNGTNVINELIRKLINYELALAGAMRKEHLSRYKSDKIILFGIIAAVVIVMLSFVVPISNSIKRTEKQLQISKHELEQANSELRRASITDGLTDLYNRRYFDQIFENEMLRAKREKLSFTFMMLDIDHFKKYNDFYGHSAGDDVITKVAKHLGHYFKRPGDLIFRLGGEEFGIITVGTSLESALKMATALVEEMKDLNIEHEASDTEHYVTISMGMVYFHEAKLMEAKVLYELTDGELYKAKENGRHQLVHKVEN